MTRHVQSLPESDISPSYGDEFNNNCRSGIRLYIGAAQHDTVDSCCRYSSGVRLFMILCRCIFRSENQLSN